MNAFKTFYKSANYSSEIRDHCYALLLFGNIIFQIILTRPLNEPLMNRF